MARILILSENLSLPFDRRVRLESRALTADGHCVVAITPRGGKRDDEPYAVVDGVEIHRYRLGAVDGSGRTGLIGYVQEYAVALWQSVRIGLRLGRFDAVHLCNPPDLLVLAALPHKWRGATVVFDQHDLVPELYLSRFNRGKDLGYWLCRALERMTYRLADHVIATNESYKAAAMGRGGKRPDQVTVVRSGPSLDDFVAVAPDSALKHGKPHLLAYLGVMGPQDGVDYALRALARLRETREDWHATFIGSGDAWQQMRDLAAELGLEGQVDFTGRIPDAELLRRLSTADVCLSPDPLNPLNDISTMNKVVEYMALSRPMVSFELREARVSAGEAALYAAANDEAAFAKRISELLDDPDERLRRGRIGRARMEESLAWEHSERHLTELYRHLINHDPVQT